MKPVRFGILGLSRIAQKNAIPALLKASGAELCMLGRRDIDKAKSAAESVGISKYGSYEDVLSDSEIDAVYVSLPNTLHEEWAIRAAQAGKHVWCEKPAALSLDSAARMVSTARENDVRLMESFAFLYHPQHAAVRNLIQRGEIGEIVGFSGTFQYPRPASGDIRLDKALGGGSYLDAAVYPIRASRMIFGEEPRSITCSLSMDAESGVDAASHIELTYPAGRTAHLTAQFSDDYRSTYTVLGTAGSIEMERAYAVAPDREVHVYLDREGSRSTIAIPPSDQFENMIGAFCGAIHGENAPDFEGDVVHQARIVDAGLRSHNEHRTIELTQDA